MYKNVTMQRLLEHTSVYLCCIWFYFQWLFPFPGFYFPHEFFDLWPSIKERRPAALAKPTLIVLPANAVLITVFIHLCIFLTVPLGFSHQITIMIVSVCMGKKEEWKEKNSVIDLPWLKEASDKPSESELFMFSNSYYRKYANLT